MRQPITLHKYAYAGNDPVLMIDPSGHNFTMGSMMAGINAVAILATAAVTRYQVAAYNNDVNFYAQSNAAQGALMVGDGSRWGNLLANWKGEDVGLDRDVPHPEEKDAIDVSNDGSASCESIKIAITTLVQRITYRRNWKGPNGEGPNSDHLERIRILEQALLRLKQMYFMACQYGQGQEPVDDFIKKIPPK
jgi:hypothetical protein